jgi:dipeptidyl aminopeptidase/acylaminoacyl peptidase
MEYTSPLQPAETGRLDGIAWCLWLPDEAIAPHRGDAVPAVIILHGAGSRKENHADFARAATAYGIAALTFDNRGHGETEGDLGASVIDDLGALAGMVADRPEIDGDRIGVRGSSMGGLMALHLGASSPSVHAVVAICPAAEWMIAKDVQRVADGKPPPEGSALNEMRIDAASLLEWLDSNDVERAVGRLGSKPLMLVHARGDEVVPPSNSERLYELADEPKRLLMLEGGDHRSAQHDAEVQGETLTWLSRALGGSR